MDIPPFLGNRVAEPGSSSSGQELSYVDADGKEKPKFLKSVQSSANLAQEAFQCAAGDIGKRSIEKRIYDFSNDRKLTEESFFNLLDREKRELAGATTIDLTNTNLFTDQVILELKDRGLLNRVTGFCFPEQKNLLTDRGFHELIDAGVLDRLDELTLNHPCLFSVCLGRLVTRPICIKSLYICNIDKDLEDAIVKLIEVGALDQLEKLSIRSGLTDRSLCALANRHQMLQEKESKGIFLEELKTRCNITNEGLIALIQTGVLDQLKILKIYSTDNAITEEVLRILCERNSVLKTLMVRSDEIKLKEIKESLITWFASSLQKLYLDIPLESEALIDLTRQEAPFLRDFSLNRGVIKEIYQELFQNSPWIKDLRKLRLEGVCDEGISTLLAVEELNLERIDFPNAEVSMEVFTVFCTSELAQKIQVLNFSRTRGLKQEHLDKIFGNFVVLRKLILMSCFSLPQNIDLPEGVEVITNLGLGKSGFF